MEISDPERLILLMLCDIYEKLGLDDFDPPFIRKAITEGHLWALRWRYSHLFGIEEATDEEVSHVREILEMWNRIEISYADLGPDDQQRVRAAHSGLAPTFPGFDGNNETTQLGIADMLTNDRARGWTQFQGRDLDAHGPTMDTHGRMLAALRRMDTHGHLTAGQIIQLMYARVHPENR
jgi:uncharacterized protein